MRFVQNFFTRKGTSSLKFKMFAKLSPYPCLTVSMEQDLGQMNHRNFSVVAAQCCAFRFDVLAKYFAPCSPSSASSDTSMPKLQYSCKEALTNPQFRPPSLQIKAVFRQGFSKIFDKFSRKVNLYNKLEHLSNLLMHSPNAEGPYVMGKTKDTKVMCLGLPWPSFLVNMLLNIGRNMSRQIYISHIPKLLPKFEPIFFSRHFKKIPQDLRNEGQVKNLLPNSHIYSDVILCTHLGLPIMAAPYWQLCRTHARRWSGRGFFIPDIRSPKQCRHGRETHMNNASNCLAVIMAHGLPSSCFKSDDKLVANEAAETNMITVLRTLHNIVAINELAVVCSIWSSHDVHVSIWMRPPISLHHPSSFDVTPYVPAP